MAIMLKLGNPGIDPDLNAQIVKIMVMVDFRNVCVLHRKSRPEIGGTAGS